MVRYEAKMQIHGSMSRTSEGGNWIVKRVCVCVCIISLNGFGGASRGRECRDVV